MGELFASPLWITVVIVCYCCLSCWQVRADISYPSFGEYNDQLQLLDKAQFIECGDDVYDQSLIVEENDYLSSLSRRWIEHSTIDTNETCTPGIRLTSAQPFQTGAMWHMNQQSLQDGFDTTFRFRVTNKSRECEERIERHTMISHYAHCSTDADVPIGSHQIDQMSGGDGFAFVMQFSEEHTNAIGSGGGGLGYLGITNSLAVEFDTFMNRDQSDSWQQHISIHSAGHEMNTPLNTRLCPDHHVVFSDAKFHQVKISYYNTLRTDFLQAGYFTGSDWLRQFMKRVLGTLCVFLDDLVNPQFCIPIDLSATLSLDAGTALVGFTASTGQHFQNHDIYEWEFREQAGTL